MMSLHGLARFAGFGGLVGLLGAASSACSDPATTPAQGAFEATFSGAHCAATDPPGPKINVGSANPQSWASIPSGTNGVNVSCTVIGAEKIAVSLRITDSRNTLELATEMTQDNKPSPITKIGLSGKNTAGGVYVPNQGTTCTATLIEGSGGRAKASFQCGETWNSVGSSDATCGFQGYFIVENCSQ